MLMDPPQLCPLSARQQVNSQRSQHFISKRGVLVSHVTPVRSSPCSPSRTDTFSNFQRSFPAMANACRWDISTASACNRAALVQHFFSGAGLGYYA